ncbi:MAG: TIGR00341 family protein [Schleiferiaceae bacterium]
MVSDPKNTPEETSSDKEQVVASSKNLFKSLWNILKDQMNIVDNARPTETIEGIQKDIQFKGYNLWILIFSIFICSIGLNVNSTPVVIGAMLISPLMGPIMGMGLAVGINDLDTLRKALKNLGIAAFVAILTSSLYFVSTPLSEASSELLARTRPTLLDVFVAFFGGLTGVLAGSRKEKNNVIPGVAIATALMPPLCTAGYGIATLQLEYFLGAFYLFLINAFFISLATILVVRVLKFPVKSFVDEATERKAKRIFGFTSIIVIVPSVLIFISVVQETIYTRRAATFITDNIYYEGSEIVKQEVEYDHEEHGNRISLFFIGETIPDKQIASWTRALKVYSLENTTLRIVQGKDNDDERQAEVGRLVDVYTQSQETIIDKENIIQNLNNKLNYIESKLLPPKLMDEIKIQYDELSQINVGQLVYLDYETKKSDTLAVFETVWKNGTPPETQTNLDYKLERWLMTRLNRDTIAYSSMIDPRTAEEIEALLNPPVQEVIDGK